MKPFDKKEAIELMMQGYYVVDSAEITKQQYQGEFYTFQSNKFIRAIAGSSPASPIVTFVDINMYPDKYWELLHIMPTMCAPILWKSNIKKGNIIELTFWRLIEEYSRTDKNRPSVLAQYNGSDGEIYAVMFTINNATRQTFEYYSSGIHNISILTNTIHVSKANAQSRIRDFVYSETEKQKTRHKSLKPLKTMELVSKIIENIPEVLV